MTDEPTHDDAGMESEPFTDAEIVVLNAAQQASQGVVSAEMSAAFEVSRRLCLAVIKAHVNGRGL